MLHILKMIRHRHPENADSIINVIIITSVLCVILGSILLLYTQT